jgi:superfamily I DNA and/or RNA helicase
MSPSICKFISDEVYEGRLTPGGFAAQNAINVDDLPANGLRYLPVEHYSNVRESSEEASVIADEIARLLCGRVTIADKPPAPLTARDILVVTPYNAQRKLILAALEERKITGIAVGTVDKFQGLEAPVVFYSMAVSSGEDAPRNIEFLFEVNRLNVAISRAQCLAVLVCSPRLLDTKCSHPEQIALVNVLCSLVEYCQFWT